MIIDVKPEFGYEIACSIPYAYWLHKQGELEKVITCKGMKPFYYFCEDVEERYDVRLVNNSTNGVQNLPNCWIHHNTHVFFEGKTYGELTDKEKEKVNGVLDYSKWISPPIKEKYRDKDFNFGDKTIIISNKISMEHGQPPLAFFDVKTLYDMFNYLSENGYTIIYKRPQMDEFVIDENEYKGLLNNYTIASEVDGHGLIDDFQLTEYYDNVLLLDDIVKNNNQYTYNEVQLKVFSNVDNFISIAGGNSIFCSLFGGNQFTYVTTSNELRPGYFDGDSYTKRLGGAEIYPVIDPETVIKERGYNDYESLMNKIKEVF